MATERPVLAAANRFTGWYIAAAVLFIVLGIFAIAEPAMAAMGLTILVGWLLIFGAIAHLVGTFRGGGVGRVLFQILSAIVFAIGGFYILSHPLIALGTLTMLLAVAILVVGVFDIVNYFRLKGTQASGWLLLNGILAVVLGGLIWVHWPSSSIWAIGTLMGVNLLFTGVTRLMYGMAGRNVLKQVSA
jgi:uncharacterized membrane protein HdeD (DUF308 family)